LKLSVAVPDDPERRGISLGLFHEETVGPHLNDVRTERSFRRRRAELLLDRDWRAISRASERVGSTDETKAGRG
jgi:hypothetical protein